jgi:four helix bundle protein
MKLEDLKAYQASMEIGEIIYEISVKWNFFDKKTVGAQVVRSADSIAANISEGYGRYFYKESKLFFYYARGSAHETDTWIRKARSRNLMTHEQSEQLHQKIEFCIALLNGLIKSTGNF